MHNVHRVLGVEMGIAFVNEWKYILWNFFFGIKYSVKTRNLKSSVKNSLSLEIKSHHFNFTFYIGLFLVPVWIVQFVQNINNPVFFDSPCIYRTSHMEKVFLTTGCPNKHRNWVTNSITSLLRISIVNPFFKKP